MDSNQLGDKPSSIFFSRLVLVNSLKIAATKF